MAIDLTHLFTENTGDRGTCQISHTCNIKSRIGEI